MSANQPTKTNDPIDLLIEELQRVKRMRCAITALETEVQRMLDYTLLPVSEAEDTPPPHVGIAPEKDGPAKAMRKPQKKASRRAMTAAVYERLPEQFTAKDVAALLGVTPKQAGNAVLGMLKRGEAVREGYGAYKKAHPKHSGIQPSDKEMAYRALRADMPAKQEGEVQS